MNQRSGIVIFDLDNCTVDDGHRLHLIKENMPPGREKYHEYHLAMVNDEANIFALQYINNAVDYGMFLVFITARPDEHFAATDAQIQKLFGLKPGIDYSIYMRPKDDFGSTPQFKRKVAEDILKTANARQVRILGAFDDRDDILDQYRAIGLNAFKLSTSGCDAPLIGQRPGALNEHSAAQFDAEEGAVGQGFTQDDGPTQRRFANAKAEAEPGVPDLLDAAKATFDDRLSRHGRADVTYGAVMAALFPNGVTLKDENDQRAFQMLGHVVGKLTRFVNSGMKHKDSIHDTITYAALLESMVDSHNIQTGA